MSVLLYGKRHEPATIVKCKIYSQSQVKRDLAIKKATTFQKEETGNEKGRIISAAKRLIFKDVASGELDTSKKGNLDLLVAAVRYIVEEVMELTPREYDALYSVSFNQKGLLDHAIRKIVMLVPSNIRKETLFDNKLILFSVCWPEYYKEHFKKPTAYQIFYADGDIKSNLSRAGKPKLIMNELEETRKLNNGDYSTAKKERKRVYTYGAEVDEVVFKAMWNMFGCMQISTRELFECLANPQKSGFNKIGCLKVIEKRECYPSALDFFMWNAPLDYQMEHVDEYMEVREDAGLEPLPILELRYNAHLNSHEITRE